MPESKQGDKEMYGTRGSAASFKRKVDGGVEKQQPMTNAERQRRYRLGQAQISALAYVLPHKYDLPDMPVSEGVTTTWRDICRKMQDLKGNATHVPKSCLIPIDTLEALYGKRKTVGDTYDACVDAYLDDSVDVLVSTADEGLKRILNKRFPVVFIPSPNYQSL